MPAPSNELDTLSITLPVRHEHQNKKFGAHAVRTCKKFTRKMAIRKKCSLFIAKRTNSFLRCETSL